jgi:glycosyltransferase involved in cell wall biosynthesis
VENSSCQFPKWRSFNVRAGADRVRRRVRAPATSVTIDGGASAPAGVAGPKVSVCIPTIDRPHFLREALASVAQQTWMDYEVVVSDNSGAPELQRKIDDVLSSFPALKVKLTRQPVRLDAADNFNGLVDAATGQLCVFLPDDDRMCPRFLAQAVAALDAHSDCAFSFADHWIINADGARDLGLTALNSSHYGRTLLREGVYGPNDLFGLVSDQSICLQTILFRRPILQKFRFIPGLTSIDQSLFMRLSLASPPLSAYYINDQVFEYRIHGDQITSVAKRESLVLDQISILESLTNVPARYQGDVRRKLGRMYLSLSLLEAERGASREARRHAFSSLRLATNVRNVLGATLVAAVPSAIPVLRRVSATIRQLKLPTPFSR